MFRSGIGKRLWNRWDHASRLAALEQEVDDVNANWIACAPNEAMATTRRRCIVMPLDERFDPPMGVFSHGHVQTGDKMSLPKVFWQAIQLNHAEVPWLFQVRRIDDHNNNDHDGAAMTATTVDSEVDSDHHNKEEDKFVPSSGTCTGSRVQLRDNQRTKRKLNKEVEEDEDDDDDEEEEERAHNNNNNNNNNKKKKKNQSIVAGAAPSMEPLDTVVGGPLDFRAPPNYVFLPWWMIRALGLKPRDVVDVQMITTVPPGSLAKLRPLSSKTLQEITNPQAVLETELRHYSSLTKGSTIAFDYNRKRYWFEVAQLRSAPRGEKQPMIKVQDCDIATDFLPAKDTVLKQQRQRQRKKQQQQQQQK